VELAAAASARLPDLAATHLGPAARTFLSLASPSTRLRRGGPCGEADPVSRLGGRPLLRRGSPWPATADGVPLTFVAQVDTAEVGAGLPPGLLLSFFYEAEGQEAWGFRPDDHPYWRVLATPVADASPAGEASFRPHRLVPERVTTIPDRWETEVEDLPGADGLYDALGHPGDYPRHRSGGWPDVVQNPMRLECQLASNGIYVGGPEGYRDPRVPSLSPGAAEWRLLLQLDTDEAAGWTWGDNGTLYYWIRAPDLATAHFDHTWLILQCY